MTVEALLLAILFVFVVLSAFTKPGATFTQHGPKLGARVENHLSVGNTFQGAGGSPAQWQRPSGPAPDGKFQ